MAQFAILIYAPTPADWSTAPDDELEAHGAFASVMTEEGAKEVAGFALDPGTAAKTARADSVTDGPAVDADLTLGGFGVIEAMDIEHAVSIARLNPATWRGAVEVRPLLAGPSED